MKKPILGSLATAHLSAREKRELSSNSPAEKERSDMLMAWSSSTFGCVFPILLATLLVVGSSAWGQNAPTFTQTVVFGDSLSDDGNVRHVMEDDYFISYPGGDFNYSDGRFTDSSDTDPSSAGFAGTWHEQLAQTFLGLSAPTNSLDGGFDYAFGGATTASGTNERTVINNPFPWGGGDFTLTVDN